MLERLKGAGDKCSTTTLAFIHSEEIGHVKHSLRWFSRLADAAGDAPIARFHALVREHWKGNLQPPFNTSARDAAGMGPEWSLPLAADEPLKGSA